MVHSSALNQLKQALSGATNRRLYVADLNKPYNIKVDASDKTVAGYLSQTGNDNVEYPLAFFSAKLSGNQKSWATVHKEAYAVLVALKKSDIGYLGQKFMCTLTTIHLRS